LNDINQLGLSRFDMVKLAQEADTMTSGRPVSVIHPFVALFGQSDKLIRVNCHTLEYEYLSLPSSEVALLLLDASRQTGSLLTDKSGVAALGGQAIATLQTLFPSLSRLSDLTTEMLDGAGKHLSSDLMAACRYALIENTATQKAYGALLKSDKDGFGSALNDVQQALFDYQAEQVEEVTFLLAAARQYQLLGARAIGFGRAGCTLNVLDESAIPAFTELAATNYRQEYNRDLRIHPLKLVNGASRISF
jgi:galactokinase